MSSIEKLEAQAERARQKAKQLAARVAQIRSLDAQRDRAKDRAAKPILGALIISSIRNGRVSSDEIWRMVEPAVRKERDRYLIRRLLGFITESTMISSDQAPMD